MGGLLFSGGGKLFFTSSFSFLELDSRSLQNSVSQILFSVLLVHSSFKILEIDGDSC